MADPVGEVSDAKADMSVLKAKLRPPAIAIIVNAGIGLAFCLFDLMLPDRARSSSEDIAFAAVKTLMILFLLGHAFSIYSALQMMNVKKHGFAVTSAIITIVYGLTSLYSLIGIPIGMWAFIVLQKPEIKSAFARNSAA